MAKEALPEFTVTVLSTVDPSRNCMVPMDVEGVRLAENDTNCPALEGFALETSEINVLPLTISISDGEDAGAFPESPL